MSTMLDLTTWPRRQHFEFFRAFAQPFFNICAQVDVTELRRLVAEHRELSLTVAYHFISMCTVNRIEPFKYRLRGDAVAVHERVHAGTTVAHENGTFVFAYFQFVDNYQHFQSAALKTIAELRNGDGRLRDDHSSDDLIHHSVVPWVSFTSISHARSVDREDSVPKISFGRIFQDGERWKMPLSVEVHHALMDGLHVGQYFELMTDYMAAPARILGLEQHS